MHVQNGLRIASPSSTQLNGIQLEALERVHGSKRMEFDGPAGIALTQDDHVHIIVVDRWNHRLQIDSRGHFSIVQALRDLNNCSSSPHGM